MNLAQQYARFCYRAGRKLYRLDEWAAHPFPEVFELFHEAEAEANRSLLAAKGTHSADLLASSTAFEYDLPLDILDQVIFERTVLIGDGDGGWKAPLKRLGAERVAEAFGDLTNPEGNAGATHWWVGRTPGKIGIGWPEGEAIAGGLRFDYLKLPTRHTGYYAQDTITAEPSNGDVAVPLSAPVPAGNIEVGHEFGVGTAASPPTRWYRIADVTVDGNGDATDIELEEAYEGEDDATAEFIVSPVSDLVKASPSESMGMIPIHYALSVALEDKSPELAAKAEAKYLAALGRALPSSIGLTHRSLRPAKRAARPIGWLGRR